MFLKKIQIPDLTPFFKALTLILLVAVLGRGQMVRAMSVVPGATDVTFGTVGGAQTQVVSVKNDGDVAHDYTMDVKLADFDDQGEVRGFYELPAALVSWVQVAPATFRAEAGAQQPVTVMVNPTFNERFRHVVLAVVAHEKMAGGESVQLAGGVASLFFVTVGDDVKAAVTFAGLGASPYDEGSATLVAATLRNEGDLPVAPTGALTVTDMWGNVVARTPFNARQKRVPFATTRTLTEVWQHGDPAAQSFVAKVRSEVQHFYLGKYTITLTVAAVDAKAQAETRTVAVWLWPKELLMSVGILLIAVLGAGGFLLKKRSVK